MELKIKEINSFSREMQAELEWNEVSQDFDNFVKKFGKNIKMPGFRPGKVPRQVLLKQFLPVIEAQFVDDNIQKYYIKGLQDEQIVPVNQAKITDVHFHHQEHLKFSAEFEIEPEISLPQLKKNSLKADKTVYVTDNEDVNLAIEEMRQSRATMNTIEGGAKEGQFMLADLQKIDESGIPVIGDRLEKRYIKLGDGIFVDDNLKKCLGLKAGDKTRVIFPAAEGQPEALYEISVINVEEQLLPKVNLEFAKQMDPKVEDVKTWKKNIKDQIEKNYAQRALEQFERGISDGLIEKVNPEYPPSMVESYLDHILEDVKANNNGAEIDDKQVRETYRSLAERNLKWYLIRKAIIKDQEYGVTKEEVDDKINQLREQSPDQVKEINKYYRKPSNRTRIEDDLMEQKIINYLTDYVKVKEVKIYTKDLRKGQK